MQRPSDREEAHGRAARGELLGPMDMAAIWGISPSRFNALNKEGKFDVFKVKPAISLRCFSGAKVHRHVQGELDEAPQPTFGRPRKAS